jgi:hypothetical protein
MNQWVWLFLFIPLLSWAGGNEEQSKYRYNSNKAYMEHYAYPKQRAMRLLKMNEFAEYRVVNSQNDQEAEVYVTLANFLLGAYKGVHALSTEGFLIYELISGENYLTGEKLCHHEKMEKYEAYISIVGHYSQALFTFALNDLVAYWEHCHVKIN